MEFAIQLKNDSFLYLSVISFIKTCLKMLTLDGLCNSTEKEISYISILKSLYYNFAVIETLDGKRKSTKKQSLYIYS